MLTIYTLERHGISIYSNPPDWALDVRTVYVSDMNRHVWIADEDIYKLDRMGRDDDEHYTKG